MHRAGSDQFGVRLFRAVLAWPKFLVRRYLSGYRPTFSLSQMLMALFAISLHLGCYGRRSNNWSTWFSTFAAVWGAIGLGAQVIDLRRSLQSQPQLCGEVRWGWRFEILWRLGVIVLLVGHFVHDYALMHRLLNLPDREGGYWLFSTHQICEIVFELALLLLLVRPSPGSLSHETARWRRIIFTTVGLTAGACWALVAWTEQTQITALVQIAIEGIEFASPRWHLPRGVGINMAERHWEFLSVSAAAVGIQLLTLAIICWLGTSWHRGRLYRASPLLFMWIPLI